jgi:hypothetical protein
MGKSIGKDVEKPYYAVGTTVWQTDQQQQLLKRLSSYDMTQIQHREMKTCVDIKSSYTKYKKSVTKEVRPHTALYEISCIGKSVGTSSSLKGMGNGIEYGISF